MSALDFVNLYSSSELFHFLILNSKCKHLFDSINNVCKEEVWDWLLSINFSTFLDELKKNLNDDLVTFFYLRFRIFSSIFHKHSVFAHFAIAKEFVIKRKLMNFIVNFVVKFFHKFLIIIILLKTLLLMNIIFLKVLTIFLKRLHFFLLMFVIIMHYG